MDIRNLPLIADTRLYEARRVSRDHGRRRLDDLEKAGAIRPEKTPTGRRLLSMVDAEILAKAL